MLLPDTFLDFKSNKKDPHLSTSLFSMVLLVSKIQYFYLLYIKPLITCLAISSNNQSYFTTNENFLNACYQNGFQIFCDPPRSIFSTKNNPICETSMFLIFQPYKCKIFITCSEYHFLTPLKFYHRWLYSTIFPRQIFLSCLKN